MNGRIREDSGKRKSGTAHSAAEIKDVFDVIVDACALEDSLQGFKVRLYRLCNRTEQLCNIATKLEKKFFWLKT